MLDLVNCKVLSIIESDDVDAYLLSESSMFVFPHKLILKTCGTTTLLCGLPRILEIATLFGGFSRNTAPPSNAIAVAAAPYRVFYSRKNFLFPDRQKGPHRSWRDEVYSLDKLFMRGSAYMIGKMNGEHWYLYLTEPYTMLTPPASPQSMDSPVTETKMLNLPSSLVTDRASKVCDGEDETLEVLMTDLDEDNAKQFYLDEASAVAEERYRGFQKDQKDQNEMVDVFSNASSDLDDINATGEPYPAELTTEGHALGTVVSDNCGLSSVYPKSKYTDSRIDAYLFTPCGFSAKTVSFQLRLAISALTTLRYMSHPSRSAPTPRSRRTFHVVRKGERLPRSSSTLWTSSSQVDLPSPCSKQRPAPTKLLLQMTTPLQMSRPVSVRLPNAMRRWT